MEGGCGESCTQLHPHALLSPRPPAGGGPGACPRGEGEGRTGVRGARLAGSGPPPPRRARLPPVTPRGLPGAAPAPGAGLGAGTWGARSAWGLRLGLGNVC